MATAKESSDFMTYFCSRWKQQYGKTYKLNRNKAKWAARDLIDSFGIDECRSALEWACHVRPEPFTWEWYVSNIDKLITAYDNAYEDERLRKERRRMAKEWLK